MSLEDITKDMSSTDLVEFNRLNSREVDRGDSEVFIEEELDRLGVIYSKPIKFETITMVGTDEELCSIKGLKNHFLIYNHLNGDKFYINKRDFLKIIKRIDGLNPHFFVD